MNGSRRRFSVKLVIIAAFALIFSAASFAAPGTGRLLGTNANGGVLLDVNPGNGAAVPIGFMGVGVTPSLATDPLSGVVYVATGQGNPVLFTVNPANAMTALVGNTGLGFAAVGGMDFDAAGNLYAAVNIAGDGGTGSDHLAILNTNNGQATIIGPFGACLGVPPIPVIGSGFCTIEGIEGIAFDASGTLWGVHTARGSAGPSCTNRGDYPANLRAEFSELRKSVVPRVVSPSGEAFLGVPHCAIVHQADEHANASGALEIGDGSASSVLVSPDSPDGFREGHRTQGVQSHRGLLVRTISRNTTSPIPSAARPIRIIISSIT